MPPTRVTTVIIGQGLAGTVLAWQLLWRGKSPVVIDDGSFPTASRIAAGLVTPITGQRLVPSWRFAEFWPAAKHFYRRVERETGRQFFREIPMVRLFQTEQERQRFSESQAADLPVSLSYPEPLVEESAFNNVWGGFEMRGGQLDVSGFLDASRNWFIERGYCQTARVDLPNDLDLPAQSVAFPKLALEAKRVIFCQGFEGLENPWFPRVPFDAAKGEILTIRVPGLKKQRVIHCGVWLAPLGDELFRAGATYDRENLDHSPTQNGRDEICRQLQTFLRRPFEVVDHHAAVRPIVIGRHPLIGLHPQHPQLGYFNGLGSKGTLQAPFVAGQFANFLQGEAEIENILNLQWRFGKTLSRIIH